MVMVAVSSAWSLPPASPATQGHPLLWLVGTEQGLCLSAAGEAAQGLSAAAALTAAEAVHGHPVPSWSRAAGTGSIHKISCVFWSRKYQRSPTSSLATGALLRKRPLAQASQ